MVTNKKLRILNLCSSLPHIQFSPLAFGFKHTGWLSVKYQQLPLASVSTCTSKQLSTSPARRFTLHLSSNQPDDKRRCRVKDADKITSKVNEVSQKKRVMVSDQGKLKSQSETATGGIWHKFLKNQAEMGTAGVGVNLIAPKAVSQPSG